MTTMLLTHFCSTEQNTGGNWSRGFKRLEQFLPPNTSKVFVIGDSRVMSLYGEIKSHLSIETSLLPFALVNLQKYWTLGLN